MKLALLCVLSFILGCFSQPFIASTDCGPVQGFLADGAIKFLGIPYAVPPQGQLRWQPPISLVSGSQCWQGTYQASNYGSSCAQDGEGNEDCLYLNIWVPLSVWNSKKLAPVLFYIHGGSLVGGSGQIDDLQNIANDTNSVVVSINYRLNAFGFLALKELSENDPRGVSGNYGFLDQILALQWTQTNIASFSGDKSKVTVFGQSSGGTSIIALLISPKSQNLFQRAFSMSGSPLMATPLAQGEEIHRNFFLNSTSCINSSSVYTCLLSLDPQSVINPQSSPAWNPGWLFGLPSPNDFIVPLPIIDGDFLPESSLTAFQSGKIPDIPLILGVMQEECDGGPGSLIVNFTISQYQNFLYNKFLAFGEEMAGKVSSVYPFQEFSSAQQGYDQISSDIGDVCGNLQLGKFLGNFQERESPLYLYIFSQGPSDPPCWVPGYCSRYAWHGWDFQLLLNSDLVHEGDLKFREEFLGNFKEFSEQGKVTSWKSVNQIDNFPENYQVMNIKQDLQVWKNAKKIQCEFWSENQFDSRWWQN